MTADPVARFGATYEIDASDAVTVNLNELRANLQPHGEHLWVAMLLFAVDDPETELDNMHLGPHNLIGAQPVTCLWCRKGYTSPTNPGPACQPVERR